MIAEPSLKKLRNRLLIINLISLTLVVSIAFSIVYLNFYNRTQNELKDTLFSIPKSVQENAVIFSSDSGYVHGEQGSRDDFTIRGGQRIPANYTKSFVVNITNDDSITVFSMLDMKSEIYVHAIETVLTGRTPSGVISVDGSSWMYSVDRRADADAPYVLSMVFLNIDDANRWMGTLLVSLIIIGIVSVAAIVLISLYVSNRAIRPVEESMVRQRRFIADASHELKTPIAVISANAEAANGAVDETERSVWINNITDEASRMHELVESLLRLAKAEEKPTDLASFDLSLAINEEVDSIEVFLFEKDISINIEENTAPGESLEIVSDKAKVQAVISVLLENALKYTPAGGKVLVTVCKDSVSISNTGEYITPEILEHLFDRFYRADSSRNSETGGHGIGLSIAKEIASAMGGELKAESVLKEEGAALNTFTFRLPH
jgi:signal transduction histidine kinase